MRAAFGLAGGRFWPLALGLLLAVGLMLLLLAGPAQAQAVDYDADDDRLIDIDSAAKLIAIRYDLNGDGTVDSSGDSTNYNLGFNNADSTNQCPTSCQGYELIADIALTANWTPIASFNTTLDGKGYEISGLTVSVSGSHAGLFGSLAASAVIRDLKITSASITNTSSSTAYNNGVLAGTVAAGATIATSYANGGLVTLSANGSAAGGLVGRLAGSITGSYSSASVAATGTNTALDLGGLVGHRADAGVITASYASGSVSSAATITSEGGLVGESAGSTGSITNSYCSAETGQTDCIGTQSGATVAAARYTAAEMQTPVGYTDMYLNWNLDLDSDSDLDYPWDFGSVSDYPELRTPAQRATATPAAQDYDTDDDRLIEIANLEQLNAVRWDLNGDGAPDTANYNAYGTAFGGRQHTADADAGRMGCPVSNGCNGYELAADLTFPATGRFSNWTPIGGFLDTTFDGKGHTLTNLTVSFAGYAGLFGEVGGLGRIRNVGMINPTVTTTTASDAAGPLAARVDNNGRIETSYVRGGTVSATANPSWIGGLVGETNGRDAVIQSSYSNATITTGQTTAVRMGGLIGQLTGRMTDSYAYGPVQSTHSTNTRGGLIGYINADASITASYCNSETHTQSACSGDQSVSYSGSAPDGKTTAELQEVLSYTGIYADWNRNSNDPWDFGTASQYPALKFDTDGNGEATPYEFGRQGRPDPNPAPPTPPSPPPYNWRADHPESYRNARHGITAACEVVTTGTGDAAVTTSTITFDLAEYARPLTLALSLWDRTHFRSLQSLGIPMPQLQRQGQTATVEVVTDPARTRFRLDGQYGLNLVLGYADCHTDDS